MDRIRAHPVVVGVVVWLVIGSLAAVVVWNLDASDRELGSRLSAHGAVGLATVTRTDPANHNTVFFSYTIGGTTYQSSGPADGPEGTADRLQVGQQIHIAYDSQDPSASCYCDPSVLREQGDWWRTAIAGVFLASVSSVVVTLMILRSRPTVRPFGSL